MVVEMLKLFFIFFKIGLFTFGGGYAMIPMMQNELSAYFTTEQLTYFIGISEATPGPFSINMAGLAGFYAFPNEIFVIQLLGSVLSTLGVIIPSFVIILLFSVFSHKIINTKAYKNAFYMFQPLILGFIFSAFLSITLKVVLGNEFLNGEISFDYIALIIFSVVLVLGLAFKKLPPIALVGISAILGLIFYTVF